MKPVTLAGGTATAVVAPATPMQQLLDQAREAERSGEWSIALERYADAFRRVTADGDAAAAADMLRAMGVVHWQRGDWELAEEHYEASLAIAHASELGQQHARALNSMAILEQFRGRIDRARELYAAARALAEELGDDRTLAMLDQNLGTLANIQGDASTAL